MRRRPAPGGQRFPALSGANSQAPAPPQMNDLLRDPSITVRMTDGGVERLSLPELFVALNADRVAVFPALRPHQRHSWHAFLAQLAAIAMDLAVGDGVPESAADWDAALRALTPCYPENEPWRLIVEDVKQPAFMQCPSPNGLEEYRREVIAPDDLDLLVTAKNHEIKQTIATEHSPEDWLFALVDLQTMAGFLGAGNYGIARMNGGFSSRPCLGLAPADAAIGAHVFHDAMRMLADRHELLERYPAYFRSQGGAALLWVEPWDGETSLDLRHLDPYFIEVCRRVRLVGEKGRITARTAPSRKPRTEAKQAKGNVGDFWSPVDIKGNKALSVSASGFTYKRLCELLFDGAVYDQPPAMRVDAPAGGHWTVVARAIANGQGKTEGYHERTDIRFSPEVVGYLSRREGRDRLAELARKQIEEIGAVTSALRLGIAIAASGGKARGELEKSDRVHADPFVRRLDASADARFFTALDRRAVADDDARQTQSAEYVQHLIDVAQGLLREAAEIVPCPSIRRHRARVKASSEFERELWEPTGVLAEFVEMLRPKEGLNKPDSGRKSKDLAPVSAQGHKRGSYYNIHR